MFPWGILGSVFKCCGLGPLVLPTQPAMRPGPLSGLHTLGKTEAAVFACQLAGIAPGVHTQNPTSSEGTPPQTAPAFSEIPLPPRRPLTCFTSVGEELEALAFPLLEHSRDTLRSDESRGVNREKNKS